MYSENHTCSLNTVESVSKLSGDDVPLNLKAERIFGMPCANVKSLPEGINGGN